LAKLSPNQFSKAFSKAASVKEQNQTMEMVNADVVDMVEQILSFQHGKVPTVHFDVPKDVYDVQKLVTKAAFRLRVILELSREGLDGSEP